MRILTLLAALLLVAAAPGQAQMREPVREASQPAPALRTAYVGDEAPAIDGVLDEAVWQRVEPATGFTQTRPDEGEPSRQRTEAYVLYDDDAVYVGARLYDTAPDSIAGSLFRRDGNDYSDWFYIHLDSYFDRRTGFSFAVNPRGVRKDFLIFDDSREDLNWDPVWSAAATIDGEGWVAEMRIPFSQLRYSAGEGGQTWGVNFQRRIARHGELAFWSPLPGDFSRYVSAFGTLDGLEDLSRPIRLEAQPYVVSRLRREPAGAPGDPFYEENALLGNVGADVKYGLTQDLTLTATINPDFGQVEVDPAVVNLSAFETFFDERRPFFIEGSEIFSYGRTRTFNSYGFAQFFYSRRIGRQPQRPLSGYDYVDAPEATTILGAAKVSGKTQNGWSIGALNAVTPVEKANFAMADGTRGQARVEPFTNYFVGRLKRDFSAGRTVVGGLVTAVNRNLDDPGFAPILHGSAYAGGLDFSHAWANRRWTLSGMLAGSLVNGSEEAILRTQRSSSRYYQRPDADYVRVDPTRTALSGYTGEVSLAKTGGEHWTGSVTYREMSPGLETNDLGFLSITDRRAFSWYAEYNERNPARTFRNYGGFAFSNHAWTYGGDNVFTAAVAGAYATFNNFWSLFGNVRYAPTVKNDVLTRGGPLAAFPASWSTFMQVESDDRKPVFAELGFFYRADVEGEYDREISLEINARPTSALQLEIEPELAFQKDVDQFITAVTDPLAAATFGRRYVFADVTSTQFSLETRVSWTFTPNLTVQLFLQPLFVATDFSGYKEFLKPGGFEFAVYGEDRGTISQEAETGRYTVDPDGDGPAEAFAFGGFGRDDFNFRSLRGNFVLRWEYRPGSTLFLVWQHARSGVDFVDDLRLGRDVDGLLAEPADNIFLVKLSYWLGQ